jgi:hypothetical protein
MHLDVVKHRVQTNVEAWIPNLLRGGAIAFSLLLRVAVGLINRALEHLPHILKVSSPVHLRLKVNMYR